MATHIQNSGSLPMTN